MKENKEKKIKNCDEISKLINIYKRLEEKQDLEIDKYQNEDNEPKDWKCNNNSQKTSKGIHRLVSYKKSGNQ